MCLRVSYTKKYENENTVQNQQIGLHRGITSVSSQVQKSVEYGFTDSGDN
jgi:hypothetical protein